MNCFECGRPAVYRHHVIPKSRGGKKTVPLCGACHALVHGRLSLHTGELTRAALRSRRAAGMIRGLRADGLPLRAICRRLEAAGIARKGLSFGSWKEKGKPHE